jgi:quercetin dioxygenase-like cupin family protein
MNPMFNTYAQDDTARADADDSALLNIAIAVELAPFGVDAANMRPPGLGLSARLLGRVNRSVLALQGFITVRHGATPWTDWRDGVRMRLLHEYGPLRSQMLELQPGAVLSLTSDAAAQEVMVLRGTLTGSVPLGPQSFLLRNSAAPDAWVAPQGALLYVRELHGPRDALPEAEARWWPMEGAATIIVATSDEGWLPFSPGVQVKLLAGSDEATSMLARFQPGARVVRHSHGLPEDCVMVQGDLYLGDLLLREGEYQLAPAGSWHDGVLSDHGSVLYFHGAIDAALRRGV